MRNDICCRSCFHLNTAILVTVVVVEVLLLLSDSYFGLNRCYLFAANIFLLQ